MIFEVLYESALKDELILVDGGYCRYHHRRDGQLTILEILVLPSYQGQGIGKMMLDLLIDKHPTSIFAKCPSELESNQWYEQCGFILENQSETRSKRIMNHWRLHLGISYD